VRADVAREGEVIVRGHDLAALIPEMLASSVVVLATELAFRQSAVRVATNKSSHVLPQGRAAAEQPSDPPGVNRTPTRERSTTASSPSQPRKIHPKHDQRSARWKIAALTAAVPLVVVGAYAQADPAYDGPRHMTAKCRDGTYSDSQHSSGTCSWHGGVESWNGASVLDRVFHAH
jgi:hypothetical protein